MDPIVVILRLLVPLLILRFPFFGGLSAFPLDGMDWYVHILTDSTLHYQELDKILDLYYLSLEAVVVSHWKARVARRIAFGLFFYRLIGTLFYELTHLRIILFLFPNIFESFFLFYLGCKKLLGKEPRLSWGLALTGVSVLTALKLIQEYPQHVQQLWQWQYIHIHLFSDTITFQYDNIFHQLGIIFIMMLIFVLLLQKHLYLKKWYRGLKKFLS